MTRRDFVSQALLASAALGPPATYTALLPAAKVGFRLENVENGSVVRSFIVRGVEDRTVDTMTLPPMLRLMAHCSLPVLFGLLDVDAWEFRPRSAVCLIRYCGSTGNFLGSKVVPLSLGAAGIVDAAFLDEGRGLLISTSAGIRNVFRLGAEGELGDLVWVHKMVPVMRRLPPRGLFIDFEHTGESRWYALERGAYCQHEQKAWLPLKREI